ncbi:MAG: glycerol-3-phosphate dehydrogenase/oxidase [Anaerolineae bacterium]|jgi:glycerol-3-phosphate dehydrogenase|nr:glycerol-3-phosphate dehydrogenase/oxidase [Anaerolineae bacterium]
MKRTETLQYIRNNPNLSVLILGGGVNGIGVLRDLALQGVDVLLVDRADFSSGTSAASSRMVHGGLRYLENGEFRLVRESVQERNWILEHAPHAVHPQPTAIPIFHWFAGLLNAPLNFLNLLNRPSERGAIITKIGLSIYDFYTGTRKTVPRHKLLTRAEALKRFPDINPTIVSAATYFDAQMAFAERICIEMILDAEEIYPQAHALNYVAPIEYQDGGVLLSDSLTGENLLVHPKIVVNAAGPWIDNVNATLGQATTFIGGTKGSHIVVNNAKLFDALGGYLIFFENADGRFVMMCRLGERVLVGSTDAYCDQPDQTICTPEEEQYFLKMIQRIFPDISVKPEEIVFRFSGVRPLPTARVKLTGQITRNHRIEVLKPSNERPYPVLSLVGGKWTTFRAFAEEVTDQILESIGQKRLVDSRTYSIGGGKGYPRTQKENWISDLHQQTGIDKDILTMWFDRYGTRTAILAQFASEQEDERPLFSLPQYTRYEIVFILQNEKVIHLDDFLLRRSLVAMEGKITYKLVQELSYIFMAELCWTEEERITETDRLASLLMDKYQVNCLNDNILLPS